ncbi:MAG: SDR family oxidoreductase [Crocinitomicaceae bacterium]|nr:SDR family oxidoreductase [Crocinitomicaceae bacterium]
MQHTEGMLREGTLSDKVILVTGGGTGLGKAMATYYSELGAKVIISSRKQEVLDKTAAEITAKSGNEVLAVAADVREYEQIENVIQKGIEKFGKINGLLNNAAGNFISPTERLSHRAFNNIIDIVLKGSTNCTLALGKYWIEKGEGPYTVVNIATTYAFTGSGFVVPSACAKAGVIAMTRSLAVEWAKYGIRLNAIAPGPFPSKGAWDRLLPGDMKDKFDMTKKIPVGRVGVKQELANLSAYLMSDYSAFVNGEVVTIDGGEWLQGAGEFNMLSMVKPEQWDMLEMMIRGVKGS